MKTIFLAAGFSTRLYPITENFPKALLQVRATPIIQLLLQQIQQLRQNETALVTNNRYFKHFETYLQKKQFPITLINNQTDDKDHRLGAIGDLLFTLDKTQWNEDLLVLPSDTLVSLDLEKFVKFATEKKQFCTVVFDKKDKQEIANQLGCAVLEGDQIIEFIEKPQNPPSTLSSVPIYFYPKHTLHLIKEYQKTSGDLDSPGAIIPWLLGKIPCYAYLIKNGYYYDVGTKEMLDRLNQ